ncbi:pectate lyase superfamily protein-domain-containing protein [Ustulina deusta]|nr:pectate lyase superfamily protein-domain-containing protein [Ustulina deusta]
MSSLIRQDVNNYFGTAPDRGSLNGPILGPLNASALARIHGATETRQDDGYWLASLGSLGQSPFAPSGYQFFRNVRDFGAVGDGVTDDTAAINRAAAAFSASDTSTLRCAGDCGSTTTLGAVVYFPPGTYLISTPIIQYYYTQFVGNPNNRAVIKGTFNFTGIALVDSNVYITGGNGDEGYINQSNFYRQIRNLEFDMTGMNWTNFMVMTRTVKTKVPDRSPCSIHTSMEYPTQSLSSQEDRHPNIMLDNFLVKNSQSIVPISRRETLLEGSSGLLYFNSRGSGYQVTSGGSSGERTGFMSLAPRKSSSLLDGSGAYFSRFKPQYAGSSPIVATYNGISNDGTGDQTDAINSLLSGNMGSIIFFPMSVYLVKGTVHIPVGSIIVGSGWSQIMGTGSFFQDMQGPTAGAVIMEWNVHESSQGSAAMWDSHFRVGGAEGTNLQPEDCPARSDGNPNCMAASLLLHITTGSSGYFDNVWVWVADHDLDNPLNAEAYNNPEGIPLNGPTWLYGTSGEHTQMYQYQLQNASNIFLGHMQTETPYYQPNPNALEPYKAGGSGFPSDPSFDNCADDLCEGAWALRILVSTDIFIYAAGFYSFFQDNQLGCTAEENCQLALIETNFASSLWIYNIFTKGNIEIVTPRGGLRPLLFNSTSRNGYTSEIAAWLALSTQGEDIGSEPGEGSGIVTIDPDLWSGEPEDPVTTTFEFPPLTTSIIVGYNSTTVFEVTGSKTTRTIYQITVVTTTISIPPVTTSVISWFDETVTANSTIIYPIPSIIGPPFPITEPTVIDDTTYPPDTRTFWPPPWPGSSEPPPDTTTPTTSTTRTSDDNDITSVHHTNDPPRPSCTHVTGCGRRCGDSIFDICLPCWIGCGIGPPGINGIDPDQSGGIPPNLDPNNPDNDPDDEECETSTFSSCNTYCTSSPTSSCSTSCRGVVIWTPTDTDADAPTLGAGGDFGYIYLPGATDPIVTTTMSPPPTLTSASTSTSTSTSTTTSTQEPEPTETIWVKDSPCDGIFVTDGNIGESTPICDIPQNNTPFDWCEDGDQAGTFVDSGPEFFEDPSCGFQIELFGERYTPEQLKPLEGGNPCDATCPGELASIQGIFLWDALPDCE